ncbi:hypothetical protein [Gordonibacter faecis]|uniref:Uncharacterized protein n=1 Tax=Gordonibacter faecis TaxID=3047475 RepID=A0ABT7DM89_9ACTN|nr:hypothetical protein [Gordonibacter sp. KGMB12511]MDJ1650618.1 hypothetical protein [Gordonibacter sp. KGMB12511]HIW75786.1 hypothetical protein [Candidatus Gordonibacter avicola]
MPARKRLPPSHEEATLQAGFRPTCFQSSHGVPLVYLPAFFLHILIEKGFTGPLFLQSAERSRTFVLALFVEVFGPKSLTLAECAKVPESAFSLRIGRELLQIIALFWPVRI